MIPICTPTGPCAKLGHRLVPSNFADVSKILKAAHVASLFCWDSCHKQPRLGGYGNIATVLIGLKRRHRWGKGQKDDFILARPASWPPTSCVHSSKKCGVWGGALSFKDTILISGHI